MTREMAPIWKLWWTIATLSTVMIVTLVYVDRRTKAQAQPNNCTTVCNSAGQCVTRCGFGYQMDLTPPPLVEPTVFNRSYVICPFLPPCWRDGQPLDGHTGQPLPHEKAQALIIRRTGQ